MTNSIHKKAEQIFRTLDHYDRINGKFGRPSQKVGFSDLYAYANDANHEPSKVLKEALSSNLKTRKDLNHLLKKQAIVTMGRAAAASSGAIERREADGFSLTLKPSKADADQIYLIIESVDRDESPTLLFIETEDGQTFRLVIDDFYDAEAQILLSVQDDIVKALRKASSEVILR